MEESSKKNILDFDENIAFETTKIVEDLYNVSGLSGKERGDCLYADFAVDVIKAYLTILSNNTPSL